MYERLEKAYGKLFEHGAKPSLVLAHGSRDLMDKFTASKFTASILDGFASATMGLLHQLEDIAPAVSIRKSRSRYAPSSERMHHAALSEVMCHQETNRFSSQSALFPATS